MDGIPWHIDYNTKVILFLLLALFAYVLCSVYLIGYAFQKAFVVYNKKLDILYEELVEKKSLCIEIPTP
jgi:hypothetical protein